ncbi:CGNR zinc finger domain-containing protein [Fodinicola feengrottensis]|uniref:Zinc finger CGNR domain-containing protein n=1 Tax=Fodinicola feengrottensis TaxID=435914 RepID=A0ABN2GEI7_9ACTN|nr:CGNR zinc finger domain-containing protein [Fodinicola feengrottensis]
MRSDDARPYAETGLVALDLANTWDEYFEDPERLPDEAALRRFCAELSEDYAPGSLAAVLALRAQLRETVTGEAAARTRALADFASRLPIKPVVGTSSGVPTLRLVAEAPDLAPRLGVRAVGELMDLAAAGKWERIHHCAASPCRDVFVDESRPGRRQFCSTTCANRVHASTSRARRSG